MPGSLCYPSSFSWLGWKEALGGTIISQSSSILLSVQGTGKLVVDTLVLVEPAQVQDYGHCPLDLPGLEWARSTAGGEPQGHCPHG